MLKKFPTARSVWIVDYSFLGRKCVLIYDDKKADRLVSRFLSLQGIEIGFFQAVGRMIARHLQTYYIPLKTEIKIRKVAQNNSPQ